MNTEKTKNIHGLLKTHKKRILILLVLTLILALATWYYLGSGNFGEIRLKGRAEAVVYTHAAEVAGKITESPVQLGQSVGEGDILFVLDDRDQVYALEQLELTLEQKQAELEKVRKGVETEQIQQAENSVSMAKAAYDKAREDYENAQALYAEGAIPKSGFEEIKYRYEVSAKQWDTAKLQLNLLAGGGDALSVAFAEAGVKLLESKISQMKETLEKYVIRAGCDGTVISVNYREGDMVSPGYDLLDIGASDPLYITAYLPAESAGLVQYGQEIKIRAHSAEYAGTLCYIDLKSEYTPKEMQSAANRNKESIKIKVEAQKNIPIKPGQEVWLLIDKDRTAS